MRIHCRLLTSTYPFADQNMYYYISNSLLLATFLKLSRDREGAVTLAPVWLRRKLLCTTTFQIPCCLRQLCRVVGNRSRVAIAQDAETEPRSASDVRMKVAVIAAI